MLGLGIIRRKQTSIYRLVNFKYKLTGKNKAISDGI
jgi:hypothetical protein